MWDAETLGSPRPAFAPGDQRGNTAERLRWVAEHEPHTWALVEQGRYVVGPAASYVLARLTLGTWHVVDPTHATVIGPLVDDAPEAALPELVASSGPVGSTQPRAFGGLAVPVTAFVASDVAAREGIDGLGIARLAGLWAGPRTRQRPPGGRTPPSP